MIVDLFQSTLPVWGATDYDNYGYGDFEISIHAPRVGSDLMPLSEISTKLSFQSTLPVWGATVFNGFFSAVIAISIHAPRVGSDCKGAGLLC